MIVQEQLNEPDIGLFVIIFYFIKHNLAFAYFKIISIHSFIHSFIDIP
jgi:hypothetical protein